MLIILEILNNDCVTLAYDVTNNMTKGTFAIVGVAAVSLAVSAGTAIGAASKAKKNAREAGREKKALEAEITRKENSRQTIINPYSGFKDISALAGDLSSLISNPYENLGVATQAAEIQMEQTDIALANTLDTLRASGASAGGATALAQAALQSKRGVSASIEQQEAQNEKLRAQGESQMQQMQMAEQQRLQGVQISEAQRIQQAQAAGEQFKFGAQESREIQKLNRLSGQQAQAQQNIAQANEARAAANSSFMSSVGQIGGAAIGQAPNMDFGGATIGANPE